MISEVMMIVLLSHNAITTTGANPLFTVSDVSLNSLDFDDHFFVIRCAETRFRRVKSSDDLLQGSMLSSTALLPPRSQTPNPECRERVSDLYLIEDERVSNLKECIVTDHDGTRELIADYSLSCCLDPHRRLRPSCSEIENGQLDSERVHPHPLEEASLEVKYFFEVFVEIQGTGTLHSVDVSADSTFRHLLRMFDVEYRAIPKFVAEEDVVVSFAGKYYRRQGLDVSLAVAGVVPDVKVSIDWLPEAEWSDIRSLFRIFRTNPGYDEKYYVPCTDGSHHKGIHNDAIFEFSTYHDFQSIHSNFEEQSRYLKKREFVNIEFDGERIVSLIVDGIPQSGRRVFQNPDPEPTAVIWWDAVRRLRLLRVLVIQSFNIKGNLSFHKLPRGLEVLDLRDNDMLNKIMNPEQCPKRIREISLPKACNVHEIKKQLPKRVQQECSFNCDSEWGC